MISFATYMNPVLTLSYNRPAIHFNEALPIGNGRMGAMHYGGVVNDRLLLNEDTLWSGKRRDWNNPKMQEALAEVRAALKEGDYRAAHALSPRLFGPWTESYLPLGSMDIEFNGLSGGEVEDYQRRLDLDGALATVTFRDQGIHHRREIFASYPDQVLVMRISADKPGNISLLAKLTSQLPHSISLAPSNELILIGQAPEHIEPNYVLDVDTPIVYGNPEESIGFCARLHACVEGGSVSYDSDQLHIKKADSVVLMLSLATSYQGFNLPLDRENALSRTKADISKASKSSFEQLCATHQADYQALFRRVKLDLGAGVDSLLPTDERIRRWSETEDPQLVTLLYQFGRYLMIASSRPGSQATNLQGIWNDQMRPPWSSNYTLNINTPMNYWPAECANLPECHEPLFELIRELAINGQETARVNYGARGWVSHHNTDLWRQTSPVGGEAKWATWYVSGAWLCQHLWQHYAFGLDKDFLRDRVWPLMRGAAEFCLDWLTKDEHGHLVTSISTSPETNFILPDGTHASLSMGSTMDMAIIRELFTNCLAAARILEIENDFTEEISAALPLLLPAQIGSNGCIQEWALDWAPEDIHHRHVSFLFGLYPGGEITHEQTPELFKAAATSLLVRGDASPGWALAWKINLWARLRDGNHVHELFKQLLRLCDPTSGISEKGGLFANLFDAHPPFQIDGNFGFTSGVTEMLVQSHAGGIDPLPALPDQWPSGSISGVRVRGGFTVEIHWDKKYWRIIRVHSAHNNICRIRVGTAPFVLRINSVAACISRDGDDWIAFSMNADDYAALERL